MNASLSELRRESSRTLQPVIHAVKEVPSAEQDQPVAEIVSKGRSNRRRAIELLAAIGPLKLPARRK